MYKVIDDSSKCQLLFSFRPNKDKGFYFANNKQANVVGKPSTFHVYFEYT